MYFVTKITNGMFMVSSEMTDIYYIVWLDNADDIDRAMETAEKSFLKWLTTEDYDKQCEGYIGVVRNAFQKADIEATFYDRIEE